MSTNYPISPPSSYVAPVAVGFADSNGYMCLVSLNEPLPVVSARGAAPVALEGTTSQSLIAGPFTPLVDSPIHLELAGEWSGRAELQRSIDSGATRASLTAGGVPWARFTGNANEVVWQEGERGATFYLAVEIDSGTLAYRISQ
jgi:hypothetical protein